MEHGNKLSKGNIFVNAVNGIVHGLRTQANLRFHLAAAILVVAAGIVFGLSPPEWTLLVLCIGLVIALELVNSSIELIADKVSTEYDSKVKAVKDMAAGAVLVAAICAAAVGLIIFIPRIALLL